MVDTFEILTINSARHTETGVGLLIDLNYSINGVEYNSPEHLYLEEDLLSPATKVISLWLADNNPEILPYTPPPEPTPEEIREQMPSITKRQLRLTLVRNGISLSELDTAILSMGDEAIIEWQDASQYNRLHPLLNQVAEYLNLSQEQVDVMWEQALVT